MKTWMGAAATMTTIALLQVSSAHAQETDLDVQRENWTGAQLFADFMGQYGRDIEACFPDYALVGGPEARPTDEDNVEQPWTRAIIAIDSSGSMAGQIGGQTKMSAAREAVREFLTGIPEDAEVGLIAFGHRGNNEDSGKAESCVGVETVAEIGALDTEKLSDALDGLDATGWTPLAGAIEQAGASFEPSDRPGEQVVFVVSDGLETCGGDPVAAARAINTGETKAIVNIIGFDIAPEDRQALEAVAEAGGGAFSNAGNAEELRSALSRRIDAMRERNRMAIGALRASNRNSIEGLRAANRASICVLRASNGENADFRRLTNAMVREGRIEPEIREEARQKLSDRHAQAMAESDAFRATIEADVDAANAPMREVLESD